MGHPECSKFHQWFHLWVENNQYAFLSISGQGHCSGLFIIGRCDIMSLHSLLHAVGVEAVLLVELYEFCEANWQWLCCCL